MNKTECPPEKVVTVKNTDDNAVNKKCVGMSRGALAKVRTELIGKTTQLPPLNNYPLTTDPVRICQGPELFQISELTGAPPRPKQYPPRTGKLIT